MSFRAGAHKGRARLRAGLARFGCDRRGVAAIEFAFIAPILLAMYFLTMEATQAIEANKKLSRVAAMVGDLATQQGSVTKDDLDAIMKIADSSLLPYHRSTPTIIATGILVTGTPLKAVVQWSRKVEDGLYSAGGEVNGDKTTLPATMMTKDRFVVRVQASLDYRPVITWSDDGKSTLGLAAAFSSLPMSETAYLSPRMTPTISCSNC